MELDIIISVSIFKIVCSQLLGSLSLILKYIFPTVPCSAQLAEQPAAGLITARRSDERREKKHYWLRPSDWNI